MEWRDLEKELNQFYDLGMKHGLREGEYRGWTTGFRDGLLLGFGVGLVFAVVVAGVAS